MHVGKIADFSICFFLASSYYQHCPEKLESQARNPNMRGGVRHIVDFFIRKGGRPGHGTGLEQLNKTLQQTYGKALPNVRLPAPGTYYLFFQLFMPPAKYASVWG